MFSRSTTRLAGSTAVLASPLSAVLVLLEPQRTVPVSSVGFRSDGRRRAGPDPGPPSAG
ncbi:hypothetical protein [Streptomyces pacificus]|uniref:hypothetical protein n=1 Tax=Streptomyces pacificus TaxID=2705029 RepID=UPI001562EBBD|nr:hypothetical protein [Streptomyces pacificus]